MSAVVYRYELRRGDEVVPTGHLCHERALEVGERLLIGGREGIVRTVEPLLGERELRLVVQLRRNPFPLRGAKNRLRNENGLPMRWTREMPATDGEPRCAQLGVPPAKNRTWARGLGNRWHCRVTLASERETQLPRRQALVRRQ
jgi:hypothetical protein